MDFKAKRFLLKATPFFKFFLVVMDCYIQCQLASLRVEQQTSSSSPKCESKTHEHGSCTLVDK